MLTLTFVISETLNALVCTIPIGDVLPKNASETVVLNLISQYSELGDLGKMGPMRKI